MARKMKRLWKDDESWGTSDDETPVEEITPPRFSTKKKKNKGKMSLVNRTDEIASQICSQVSKHLEKVITGSLEKVTERLEKRLEKLSEGQNDLRKQLELHINSPSSQLSQEQPPKYRLEFKSNMDAEIKKGESLEIQVALVDCNSGQTVENGPLASATVELVVIDAKFNENNNLHNWSKEDFRGNIKKAGQGKSAAVNVDESEISIVSNGRFNLENGVKHHCDFSIFKNSSNKRFRLGVMVVSTTKSTTQERVLEGLSNPFFVRGCDRPNRKQAQAGSGNQKQNGPMSNMQNPSYPNSTRADGNAQAWVGNGNQQQNRPMYTMQNPSYPNVTQAVVNVQAWFGNGNVQQNGPMSNMQNVSYPNSTRADGNAQAWVGNGNQQQNRPMSNMQNPSYSNSTQADGNARLGNGNQQQNGPNYNMQNPSYPNSAQAGGNGLDTIGQTFASFVQQVQQDELALIEAFLIDHTEQIVNSGTGWHEGVTNEPLEPDADEGRPKRRKRHIKYHLQFVNKVCEAYYTRDQIKADDGNLLMVALFDENNTRITSGPLSSASVEVVALHGDFNVNGQDYWTSEDFNQSVVCLCPPRGEEALSVLGGDRILVLVDGEACLRDAYFQITSSCARTGKFKMGVMLASAQDETVQEGISEPFAVMDNRVEELDAKDGSTQGFDSATHMMGILNAAATLQFPRNIATEPIMGDGDGTDMDIPDILDHLDPWDMPTSFVLRKNKGKSLRTYSVYWKDKKEFRAIRSAGESSADASPSYVGLRRTLQFYRTNHLKTDWIIHEYHHLLKDDSGPSLFLEGDIVAWKVFQYEKHAVSSAFSELDRRLNADNDDEEYCNGDGMNITDITTPIDYKDTPSFVFPKGQGILVHRKRKVDRWLHNDDEENFSGEGVDKKRKRTGAARKNKSEVWTHFTKIYNTDRVLECVVCHTCDRGYNHSTKNGTSYLRRHHKSCANKLHWAENANDASIKWEAEIWPLFLPFKNYGEAEHQGYAEARSQ